MATPGERSIADVLNDIVDNVQQIVRSEMRLAKAELREDLNKLKFAAVLFACGAVTGILGGGFVLLAIVYALATVVAPWASALIVGVGAVVVAGILVASAGKTLKHVGIPGVTETMREDVQWAKARIK